MIFQKRNIAQVYILPEEVAHNCPYRHPSINVQLRSGLYPELAPKGKSHFLHQLFL